MEKNTVSSDAGLCSMFLFKNFKYSLLDLQTKKIDETTKNLQEKCKTSLVIRRNVKTSLLHSASRDSLQDRIYNIEVDAKIDDARATLKEFKLKNNGSFDSGTSSAQPSPKIIPISLYSFN